MVEPCIHMHIEMHMVQIHIKILHKNNLWMSLTQITCTCWYVQPVLILTTNPWRILQSIILLSSNQHVMIKSPVNTKPACNEIINHSMISSVNKFPTTHDLWILEVTSKFCITVSSYKSANTQSIYRQISDTRCTKYQNLNVSHLAVVFAQSIEARC